MRNLKIEELYAGSYVQMLFLDSVSFASPMLVAKVCKDGKVLLERMDNTSFETDIKNICPIPIDERVLEGFGFVKVKGDNVWMKAFGNIRLTVGLRWSGGVQICRRCAISGRIACWNEEIRYIHELQRWWNDRVFFPYDVPMELKWRGIREKKEEL